MNADPKKRKRFPWVMTILTIAVIASFVIARRFDIPMSDTVFHFDYAILNIFTMLAIPVLAFLWLVWLTFFSRWPKLYARTIPLVIITLTVIFLVLYRPRWDGSLGLRRWEPRFWQSSTVTLKDVDRTVELSDTSDDDFPQFLGADRNGVVKTNSIEFNRLDDQCELVWKRPVGQAWSGFIVSGGYAFTMMQEGGDELVVCLDLDNGEEQWVYRHSRRHDDPLGGVGPRGTPTIHEGKIYALGANGLLVCLDASSGSLVWKVDVAKMLGIELVARDTVNGQRQIEQSTVTWGRSASPLIYDEKVIVPAGGPKTRTPVSLIAFDKETGEEIWRGGEQGISYGSPVVAEIHGSDQILIVNESSAAGHDPATGRELWRHPWPGHSDSDANTSQPTIAGDNRVLLSKGYGVGAELIEIEKNDQGFSTKSLWRSQRVLKTKMTNPVINDGYAYGLSDRILECVDLKTGERVWKNGRYGHGQLLLVNDHLLIHAEQGFLALVPASPERFEEHGRVETVDGISWNTLCVSGPFVLVRSDLEAACFKITSGEAQ